MLAWLALVVGAIGAAALYRLRVRHTQPALFDAAAMPFSPSAVSVTVNNTAPIAPFQTDAIVDVHSASYRLAFGVRRFDYRIFDDHAKIIERVTASLSEALQNQQHFPRRPNLLPKLLRAINDADSTREELARLILQDPVLAGNVLKRANSTFYRHNAVPVESIERAIVVLGFEGLRAPVAAAVMQPVFQLPRGFFDQFAPMTWEQAQRSAAAAETYARVHQAGDPFTANLIGLLGGLGRIVMFRIALDQYRQTSNLMPRAEVFIQLMMQHSRSLTRHIAASWEMSDAFLAAIDAQLEQQLPTMMTPMGKALYYGELAGVLALIERHDNAARDASLAILEQQGLDRGTCESLLNAASDFN
jgi:HD-like signal output (HDOD) protein